MEIYKLQINKIHLYEEKIVDLLQQSYLQSFPNMPVEINFFYDRLNKLKFFLSEGNASVFCAIDDNGLHGFVWFFLKNDTTIHINQITVDNKLKRQGTGTMLIKAVEEFAIINDIKEIELLVTISNGEAMNFYTHNEYESERIVMKKRLV